MDEIWNRIITWLNLHAKDIAADLNPPATEPELESVAREIGHMLPADVTASYRIHNGSRGGSGPLFAKWRLLSLENAIKEWHLMHELETSGDFEETEVDADRGVRAAWWSSSWFPLMSNGAGDLLCVDLDPQSFGRPGQLIKFLHADPRRSMLAESFAEWLEAFAKALEAGRYEVVNERLSEKASVG